MIEVRVPATSANLGPGFDCMGLAVSAYAKFTFTVLDHGLEIIGGSPDWQNEHNLVYQAFVKTLAYMGEQVPGLRIEIDSEDIPEARGLGSSAVCIVAGAFGANECFQNRLNKYEIFDICTQMEGHPDNVAPAIFGSLTISFMEDGKPNMIRYLVDRNLIFCAIIPDYPTLTHDAREVLPKQMSYQDAIYQIGHCAALAKALEINNPMIIKKACQDKMHQPYRKSLIKEYDDVYTACEMHGALACYISGSGSTMMAIVDDEDKADALLGDIVVTYPTWNVKKLKVDLKGAQVEEK